MIKSILLAIDGSVYTDSVVNHGIHLAKKLNAVLRIYTVIDIRIYEWVLNTGGEGYMPVIPSNVFHDESYKFHTERAGDLINSIQKRLSDSGVEFEAGKLEGAPVDVICELSRQVDLVIMGARGDYARWGDRMLGETVESVSRQITSPLMIVDKKFVEFKSVTCAYDRSESATNALKLTAYMAGEFKNPVEVVTINDDQKEREEILEEARNYLAPYALEAKFRHEVGDAGKVLIQTTRDVPEPTLLVMGRYGHSRIREAILGSTTVEVMRGSVKPIILTK